MKVPAAQFKAKCLSLVDRVHDRGEVVAITKRGHVIAKLIPAGETYERPWMRLAGMARWHGDALAPITECETPRRSDRRRSR
jgi:prevent-host-death family protein